MKINVAKTAGFCFGVNRAVQTVYDLLEQKKHVYTLGPIIHNNRMIEELHSKGVNIINSIDEAPLDATVVIRAHGVPEKTVEILNQKKINYVDATCPFVSKIHTIVKKASEDKQTVFIFGNRDHPEVIGIRGHCKDVIVFSNYEEFEQYTKENPQRYHRGTVQVC